MPDERAALGRAAATLAAAGLGAGLFALLALPLPWLLGPMAATALAALLGGAPTVPAPLRAGALGLLGILLGARFTPELVARSWAWAASLAALALYVPLATLIGVLLLRRALPDMRARLLAATPGGLSEMVALAAARETGVARVAAVHGMRVLLLVTVAALLANPAARPPSFSQAAALAPEEGLLVLLAAIAAILGARRLRLPAPELLAGLLAAASLYAFGVVDGNPPAVLGSLAQLVVGAATGARLRDLGRRGLVASLQSASLLTAAMALLSAALAWLVSLASGIAFPVLLLAYMPGGVAEMSALALALGLDAGFVAAHHLFRILVIVLLAPTALAWLERRSKDIARRRRRHRPGRRRLRV